MKNVGGVQQTTPTILKGCINDTKKKNPEIAGIFNQILKNKQDTNMNAKAYLASLTPKELYAIKKVYNMEFNIADLSDEGAENLLVSPENVRDYVDLNNDGVTEIGEAKSFIFPPPNAPDSVKDAWDESISDLTPAEMVKVNLGFLLPHTSKPMPDGTYKIIGPLDPDYKSPYGNSVDDYYNILDNRINWMKNDPYNYGESQRETRAFMLKILMTFRNNFEKYENM